MTAARTAVLLLAALLMAPAHAQTRGGQPAPAAAPAASALACGNLKAESTRASPPSSMQWTIAGPSGKTTETGVLRSGPRFECLDGTVLIVEFTSTAGHSFFEAYFPDGTSIGYGRQQIDRRGGRFVLPIQARARIATAFRGSFDYHCRLDMPADPISQAARADCVF